MSSDPRSGAPSSDPEAGGAVVVGSGAEPPLPRETTSDLPTLIRARGATLLDALELHLPGAREHADGAASYAFAAAVEIGAGRRSAESIRETARLHEIGKIYVPTSVLAKGAEELDQQERALLESIPANGAELARGAGIPGEACAWIGETGERFDGAGPKGNAGERIPLESRIIRVACACDAALSAVEPGSGRRPHAEAIAALRGAGGQELDPRVVDGLVAMLDRVAGRA
jgi:HD-GYP domain-containing protein (c-di-GMP phosphodiesterase class II)